MQSWVNIANFIIAVSGFGLALYTLYMQRKDRKPILKVEPKLTLRKIKLVTDNVGGRWHKDDFCMVITLRNPTDKDIQVEEISFVDEKGSTAITPWQSLPLVPSHKTAEVIIQLENLVIPMGWKTQNIGHFSVRDVLGNISKSGEAFFDIANRQSFFPTEEDYNKWIVGYRPELDSRSTEL